MTGPTVRSVTFDCPVCGARADDCILIVDAEVVETYPLVPIWEGGPLVSDISQPPEVHRVDSIASTDACGDSFSMTLWDLALVEHPDGRGELQLTRKTG